jgi:hypothetical protein
MKKKFISQALGLFWFVIVYALVRLAVAGPLSFQNTDMLSIVIGVISLMWVMVNIIQSEEKCLETSASLLAVSIVLLFCFRIYDTADLYVQFSTIAMLAIYFLIFFTLLFRLMRSKKEAWKVCYFVFVITQMLIVMAIVVAIEIYLVPLI